jgi:hypothetical protein
VVYIDKLESKRCFNALISLLGNSIVVVFLSSFLVLISVLFLFLISLSKSISSKSSSVSLNTSYSSTLAVISFNNSFSSSVLPTKLSFLILNTSGLSLIIFCTVLYLILSFSSTLSNSSSLSILIDLYNLLILVLNKEN